MLQGSNNLFFSFRNITSQSQRCHVLILSKSLLNFAFIMLLYGLRSCNERILSCYVLNPFCDTCGMSLWLISKNAVCILQKPQYWHIDHRHHICKFSIVNFLQETPRHQALIQRRPLSSWPLQGSFQQRIKSFCLSSEQCSAFSTLQKHRDSDSNRLNCFPSLIPL